MQDLTLEQKAELVVGAGFWATVGVEGAGIPPITVTDGPHGVRLQRAGGDALGIGDSVPATCFPPAAGSRVELESRPRRARGHRPR